VQSEDTQVFNPNLTIIDSRWFDLGIFGDDEVVKPKSDKPPVLYIAARESKNEDDTARLLREQTFAGIQFAMENCFSHVVCFDQVIPAKGNDIEMHKEIFRLIASSSRRPEIFINKTDRASRSVEYGKWFWNQAKANNAVINTAMRTFPLTPKGRKQWLEEIQANEINNNLRRAGNTRSHARSQLDSTWRYKPWTGYFKSEEALVPYQDWSSLATEIMNLHNRVGVDFLLESLSENVLWQRFFLRGKHEASYKVLTNSICDARNAGWKVYGDGEVGDLVQGNWEPVFSLDFFIEANLLYPLKEQLELIKPARAPLNKKLRCAECGERLVTTGAFYRNASTGEVLADKVAYTCPQAFNRHNKRRKTCKLRQMYDVDVLHQQVPRIVEEMSQRTDRPNDMRQRWEAASDEVRVLLVKNYIKHSLYVSDGVLQAPKRSTASKPL